MYKVKDKLKGDWSRIMSNKNEKVHLKAEPVKVSKIAHQPQNFNPLQIPSIHFKDRGGRVGAFSAKSIKVSC